MRLLKSVLSLFIIIYCLINKGKYFNVFKKKPIGKFIPQAVYNWEPLIQYPLNASVVEHVHGLQENPGGSNSPSSFDFHKKDA